MNLQHIKYFIALANTKNFTKAAEQVFVVQSTFSAGIKKLESHLGVKLFERDKRNVSLTSAGEILLPKAMEIMNNWYSIEKTFEIQSSLELRIGFVQNIDVNVVLPFINEFKKQYINSEVQIFEEKHDVLLNKLDTNEIHAFFTEERKIDLEKYHIYDIADEELFFAVNYKHPFAKKKSIKLSALENQPFIERSHCMLYNDVFSVLKERNIQPKKVFTAHNNETVGALITSDMGVTLMPKPFFEMPEVKFLKIEDAVLARKIILVTKSSGILKEVKDFLRVINSNDQ
ncbi:LysR family transcriptional regulator [Aureivirga sp. CE67]|uniref:LysR family transcriptional regulator n=1 Tax=Aureivirga sp. CE67 TaxID=1788983 RepID=UPI0018C8F4A6|nr:LysR family transcriptional regulator [Aureivirga sp. CE67]